MDDSGVSKKNRAMITGILLLSIGMQFANYGTTIAIAGEIAKMDAMAYYVLVAALGTLGMMLILPIIGKLTAIFGQRNMIVMGILVQLLGRVLMMFCHSWIPYAGAYLLQSIGGGLYTTAAYVLMTIAVAPQERVKYFGYIAVANAIGAIFGPLVASAMYSAGGVMAMLSYISNFPLALIGFLLVAKHCPNQKTPGAAKGFDYLGVVLSVVSLACLVFWLNLGGKMFQWISLPSIVLLVLAAGGLVWVITRELKINKPAIPLKMFHNRRLVFAFIGSMVIAAYATCTTTYIVMWVRMNYAALPGGTIFSGTYNMAQQIVILVLGMVIGGYIGKQFTKRFRPFGIAAMVVAFAATLILMCLKFTGTAAGGDLKFIGALPVGMLLIYLATGIGGFALVVSSSAFPAFWQSNTPGEQIPSGQALYSFGSMFGSVLCNAIVGVVLGTSTDYIKAFAVGSVINFIGIVCAVAGFKFNKEEVTAAN